MFNGAAGSDPMPLAAAVGLGVLLMVAGVLVGAVARRSADGTLRRNALVGIRTTATMASDEAWARAHHAGARSLGVAAVGTTAAGILLLFRLSNAVGLAVVSFGLAWLLVWVLRAGYLGVQAAKVDD